MDEAMTVGNLLTIHGTGLKIDGTDENHDKIGLHFDLVDNIGSPVKVEIIAVNEPRTLKIIVPPDIKSGESYCLRIVTQTSAKTHGRLVKESREARSDIILTEL